MGLQLLAPADFDAIVQAAGIEFSDSDVPARRVARQGWRPRLNRALENYFLASQMAEFTPAGERERWASEIGNYARSLLFALGVDPQGDTGETKLPLGALEWLAQSLSDVRVRRLGEQAFPSDGIPPPPLTSFDLAMVADWPKEDEPGMWRDRDGLLTGRALRITDLLNRAAASVALFGALADHQARAAHASKGRLKMRHSVRHLFAECNTIFTDATGRPAGGSRHPETGEISGPCVRFYLELFERVRARTTPDMLTRAPNFLKALDLSPRAVLERIQEADAIRSRPRDEKSASGL